jgi:3-methyladenine DNA glycosylase AlkD
MVNNFHAELLTSIQAHSGKGNSHTASDSYLGNSNPRYAITAPVLRTIASAWMRSHKDLTASQIASVIGSLIKGASSTEKILAGILLGYTTKAQRDFPPKHFDEWLDDLQGWAEVDAVCTGEYTITHIPLRWNEWKPLLRKFSKSNNINKRRAALVLFTSLVRYTDDQDIGTVAFGNIEKLQEETDILITRAISWLLRSLIKNYRTQVETYLQEHSDALPRIAVRETMVKLRTGTKTKRKK